MIEKLEELAANECDAWLEMDYEDQVEFSVKFALFVDSQPTEMEEYLLKQEVTAFGTLFIAFEAISKFSKHPEIILPAVKKVLDAPYTVDEDSLFSMTVLEDIDTMDLFDNHPNVYMQLMDLLIMRLQPEKEMHYLLQLMEAFDCALVIPIEPEYKQYLRKQWFDKLTDFANYGSSLKLKLKAREVVKNSEQECDLIPLTFSEKVKKMLGVG